MVAFELAGLQVDAEIDLGRARGDAAWRAGILEGQILDVLSDDLDTGRLSGLRAPRHSRLHRSFFILREKRARALPRIALL